MDLKTGSMPDIRAVLSYWTSNFFLHFPKHGHKVVSAVVYSTADISQSVTARKEHWLWVLALQFSVPSIHRSRIQITEMVTCLVKHINVLVSTQNEQT